MRSVSSTRSEKKGRSWKNNWTLRSVYSRNQTLKRNIRTTVTSQPQACKIFLPFKNRVGGFKSHSGCGSNCLHKVYLFFPLWVLMTFWFPNHWVYQLFRNKSEKPKGGVIFSYWSLLPGPETFIGFLLTEANYKKRWQILTPGFCRMS